MSCECGCCAGVHVATPEVEQNRPGLSRIGHRPGDFATFFESMQARLSAADHPELAALKTRALDDATIAICDAWAVAADVLSFYQDRIANEGYLRTATERRSLIELGRLTGYALRPGVSASVYLAYELDANAGNVTIPIGTRAQSVPGAGEKMQTFETAEVLAARAAWSRIRVRASQPAWRSTKETDDDYGVLVKGLTFRGTATRLKPNDVLLIDYGDRVTKRPYRVASVTADDAAQTTQVMLRAWSEPARRVVRKPFARISSAALVAQLETPLTLQPRNATRLARNVATTLSRGGEIYSRLLTRRSPALGEMLIPALRSFDAAGPARDPITVHAMRSTTGLFGSAAPNSVMMSIDDDTPSFQPLDVYTAWNDLPDVHDLDGHLTVKLTTVPLDAVADSIKPSGDDVDPSYAIVDFGGLDLEDDLGSLSTPRVRKVVATRATTMSIGAAISMKTTQLDTDTPWFVLSDDNGSSPAVLRNAQVYAASEALELANDLLDAPVAGDVSANEIELDAFYDGLSPGLWVIAAGARADIEDAEVEVAAAERAMIAAVRHDVVRLPPAVANSDNPVPLPGDTLHTFVKLAAPLAYTYRRDTFTLYGNVVRATHGETRNEPLGGGDATRTYQSFTLKSPPLTYVSAPTPSGVASTLKVRVSKLLWKETDDLASSAADARAYATRRDDSEATTIRFGNGVHGARLPTGADNVAAVYGSGIGAAGNVRAAQITLATDKPLGVKGVVNPIRGSGGADADTIEQARTNAPLAVTALDRLVSIRDYADFARSFAGIGKATSSRLRQGLKSVVHVTIAGIDDEPIDATSDLFVNLVAALRAYGDPHLPVEVQVRTALSLVIQASVGIDPDYAWEDVQPRVRQALLDRFGFAARELGEPVFRSAIIAAIESVRGVAHVLGLKVRALDFATLVAGLDPVVTPSPAPGDGPRGVAIASRDDATNGWLDVDAGGVAPDGSFTPAAIAYLPVDVADCLILELAS